MSHPILLATLLVLSAACSGGSERAASELPDGGPTRSDAHADGAPSPMPDPAPEEADAGLSDQAQVFSSDACQGTPLTLSQAEQSLGSLGFYQFALRIRECDIDTDVCQPWEYQNITDLTWSTLASGVIKLAHSSGGGELRLWLEQSQNCGVNDSYQYIGASCTGLGGTLTCTAYHDCDEPLELITYQGWVNDTRYARFTGKITEGCVQLRAHSSLDYLGTSNEYGPRYEREAAILLHY